MRYSLHNNVECSCVKQLHMADQFNWKFQMLKIEHNMMRYLNKLRCTILIEPSDENNQQNIYQGHNNVNRARYTRQITSRTRFPDMCVCCCRRELTRAAAIKSVMREFRVERMVPSGHLSSLILRISFFLSLLVQ